MNPNETLYPVGARVLIRDAVWRITKVDPTRSAGARLTCTGLSDIVRGKTGIFFEHYEEEGSIQVLRPQQTRLVEDTSSGFIDSKIYLEALIRKAPKTDPTKIEIADGAAMDPLPYQFDPALQALKQPRARILIADSVGIGKTLEAGILVSELIARGRGKRILVLVTKAMLGQFQKEFWTRFSIPLTALDSIGIQRVKNKIPANHNPFLYIDRAIISIDTLKQTDSTFSENLKNADWDIIVIDEAHNVAQRSTRSQRSKLAQMLANRSDTMIMLSATPHDGRAESFASLLNILDPTAIANPSDYRVEDFASKGLVIRRFKKDIKAQLKQSFPDREISLIEAKASPAEEAVYNKLSSLTFETLDSRERLGAQLFATVLTKAFFSSPAACSAVITHRIANLKRKSEETRDPLLPTKIARDTDKLTELKSLVDAVTPESFSKFQKLVALLRKDSPESMGWTGEDTTDRLVIFTESVETLSFLAHYLPAAAHLKKDAVADLSGRMSDIELGEIISRFNDPTSPLRLLLCSDVASEGLNLHRCAHRMIHFDIPWSLMTFQQRNGRIDRYGQTQKPYICYLQTQSANETIAGDNRVLSLLIEKDKQAQTNLSDPLEFGTREEQEDETAAQMEGHGTLSTDPDDFIQMLIGQIEEEKNNSAPATALAPVLTESEYREHIAGRIHLFESDIAYAKAVLSRLYAENTPRELLPEFAPDGRHIYLPIAGDLSERVKFLPPEMLPSDRRFHLTDDPREVEAQIRSQSGEDWPSENLLWELHPVMKWLEERALSSFGRHTAPVLHLTGLKTGERWALLQGGFPNRRGFIPIFRWIAVREMQGSYSVHTLPDLIASLGLKSTLTNLTPQPDSAEQEKERDVSERFKDFVSESVQMARDELLAARQEYESGEKQRLLAQLEDLKKLKEKHMRQLEMDFGDTAAQPVALRQARRNERAHQIEEAFLAAQTHISNTAETETEPYLMLCAVFAP